MLGYQILQLSGLSPRVRGNHAKSSAYSVFSRSIPACAGEPCSSRSFWPCNTVYPRVCGGTIISEPNKSSAAGLSPRVRGNLRLLQ